MSYPAASILLRSVPLRRARSEVGPLADEVGTSGVPQPSPDELIRVAVEVCGASSATICLANEEAGWLKTFGPARPDRSEQTTVPLSGSALERWRHVRDAEDWLWLAHEIANETAGHAVSGADAGAPRDACFPIRLDGVPIGYVCLTFDRAAQLSRTRLQVVRMLAQQVSLGRDVDRLGGSHDARTLTLDKLKAVGEQVRSLVQVNDALRASSDRLESGSLDQFLESIVRHAVEIAGASAGSLAFPSDDESRLEVVGPLKRDPVGGGLKAIVAAERIIPLTGFAREVWEDIKKGGEHLWQRLDERRIPAAMRSWYEDRGYQEALLVPIRLGGTTFGHLALIFGPQERPSDVQLQVARVLAQQAGVAIRMKSLGDSARQAAIAHERAAQLDAANEALRRSIERIAGEASGRDVLHSVLAESVRLVGANGGLISAIGPGEGNPLEPVAIELHGQRLSIEAWHDISGIELVAKRSVEDPNGFFGRIRAGDEAILDIEAQASAWWPDALTFMRRVGAKQCVGLPIRSRGVSGLLVLWLADADPPAPELIAQLRTFALQAALSLELLRFRETTSKSATEAERARLAGEIHDGLAQVFLAVMVQARAARITRSLRKGGVSQFLDGIESLAAEGLEEARRSVFALRSITVESDGLVAALGRLVGSLSLTGRTQCVLVDRAGPIEISPVAEDAIYRIVQEATQNALKHAGAREVKVELRQADGRLEVSIEDDGFGIAADVIQQARERGGLRAMRDRAERCSGSLVVGARSPRGTRVTVLLPVGSVPR